MAFDLPLACSCGALRGVASGISPDRGNRLVCYCDDCQSFPVFLGQAERTLDTSGGTEIFQTSPARVRFTEGADRLACLRLRPNGLLRWYAACCRTPIANTPPRPGLPFVGLIHTGLHPGEGRSRDEVLGPVRGGVYGRFAKGDRSAVEAPDRLSLAMVLRFVRILAGARLRGDQRRSPFFDSEGHPVAKPTVLSPEELARVEAERDRR